VTEPEDDERRLIDFRRVEVVRGGRRVLADVNLQIGTDEHVAIVGPNGAGKSTLLKLIARECYAVPGEGVVCRILGRERWNVFDLRSELGIVTNDLALQLAPDATLADIVLSGFFSSASVESFHAVTPSMRERAEQALARLGITHLAERRFDAVSSGELRRATIARALVHRPQALVLDEPSTSLDVAARRELRVAMRSLAREGVAIVLVTHELEDVIPEIGRVVLLARGRVAADGPKAELFSEGALARLFGVDVRVAEVDGIYTMR
jgi:iron complex transport system ATP-binding protein